ncbi:hypothetical protein BP6252_08663 [Coleophoma cylindrospora]|uniref:Uncharacterized protein n=1 Tax=Coleophoma cylindrospora TaxID=1849047 RepID=A0A3D8R6H7_9HELO|nr:hypothetical protein BP6252_08663 [Coleophoma cylindrospora]
MLLFGLASLFLGATARLAPQARYANASAPVTASAAVGGPAMPESTSLVSDSSLASVILIVETNNPGPPETETVMPIPGPALSHSMPPNVSSKNSTAYTTSTISLIPTLGNSNHTTITSTWEPSTTASADGDTSTDDSTTSQTDCIPLLLGLPETIYEIVPNTTTITLPYGTNATKTPEFTPTPYCSTSTAAGELATSTILVVPFAGFAHQTTTVVITEKNPTTVYTSNRVPNFPGLVDTKKVSVATTTEDTVPTFPAESPFSTTTSASPTATAGTQSGSDFSGNGGSSPSSSSSGSTSTGGASSSGDSSSGGSSSGGDGSSGSSSSGSSSSGSSSSGSSSSGSSSSGSSSSGSSSSGSSSSGSSSGDGSSDGSSSGSGSSSGGDSSSSGSSSGGASSSGSGSGSGTSSGSGSDNNGQATSPTISVTAGGVPIVLTPTNVVVNGQTVTVGSNIAPTTVVANQQTFTIDASQVIAPGTVISVPTAQGSSNASPTSTVIGGATVSLGDNVIYVGGTSYSFGVGAVQTTVVQNGRTISIGSAGVGFAKTTVTAAPVQTTAYLVLGGDVFYAVGASVAVFGQDTITYGSGIPQTTEVYNGETITIGPGGITQATTTLGGASHPTGTQIGIAGGLGVTEIGSSIVVIQSTTFTIGPNAGTTTAVIMGNTISANPSAIEIGTTTILSYPLNPTTQAVTAGGVTFSEIGTSLVVLGGTTFTIGPGAKTTTDVYNSQTISIGPGGVGFKTTTVVPPSATATGKKNGVGKVQPVLLALGIGICMAIGVGYSI